jgi:hypothetical protein
VFTRRDARLDNYGIAAVPDLASQAYQQRPTLKM